MADDPGQDSKSSRPVRKSKQIAEDMRLAMMMANQLSKQIDKAERVSEILGLVFLCVPLTALNQAGASDCKKKKAADAVGVAATPRLSAAPPSPSPASTPSKKSKREDSGQLLFLLKKNFFHKPTVHLANNRLFSCDLSARWAWTQ